MEFEYDLFSVALSENSNKTVSCPATFWRTYLGGSVKDPLNSRTRDPADVITNRSVINTAKIIWQLCLMAADY